MAYEDFPSGDQFLQVDLDNGQIPSADEIADAAAAVETTKDLGNPRALLRDLVRLGKPEGWVSLPLPIS